MILEILLPTITTLIIGFVGALAVKKILIVVRYETQNGFTKINHDEIKKIKVQYEILNDNLQNLETKMDEGFEKIENRLPKKKKQKNKNIRVMPLTRKEIKKIKRKGIT